MISSDLQSKLARHQKPPAWSPGKVLTLAVAAVVILLLLFRLPSIIALYQLYWSGDGIRRLFYEDLGFSDSWSHFIAVVGAFVYALAWVPLTVWTYRLVAWRFDARQLAIAFASWVFVYGHAPLLHALFGTNACFNQRTGDPMKWYVELADGTIVLYDSAGYDSATGTQKKPVSMAICSAYEAQRKNDRPHKITADPSAVDFFDPVTSRPRVWYTKDAGGNYTLYDARGFDPASGKPLLPVTPDVVQEIQAQISAAKDEQRRRDADAQLKRQQELEQQEQQERRRQEEQAAAARAQDDARRKAQQDAIDRQNAERQRQQDLINQRNAEIQRQLEEQRRQAELQRQLAEQKQQQQNAWRSSHGGCNFPLQLRYFDCQRTNAPECIHIGGNGGYACAQ